MLEDRTKRVLEQQWSNLTLERLTKLDESYIRLHEGCIDLYEYLPNLNFDEELDKVKFKNAGFILTYLDSILMKDKHLFSDTEFTELNTKVKALKKFINEGIEVKGKNVKVFDYFRSDLHKTNTFRLNSNFDLLVKEISIIYEKIIDALKDILYLPGNIRSNKK